MTIEYTLTYNRFKKKVYNYVLKMIGDKMSAEDIVQTIFLKLFENWNNIQNKNNIEFWIFRTTRNEVYGYYRTKKVRLDQFNVEDSDELEIDSLTYIDELFEIAEMKELLNKTLNQMPPEQKEIFILKEYSGLSYNEIASLLQIEEKLVKSRLFKVRQKLIDKLSKKIIE